MGAGEESARLENQRCWWFAGLKVEAAGAGALRPGSRVAAVCDAGSVSSLRENAACACVSECW